MSLSSLDKDNVNRLMKSLAIQEIKNEKYIEIMRYNTTTCAKLQMLSTQIEYLKTQANKIINTAILNKRLHEAECKFSKVMGQIYHFYEREGCDTLYCSLISPNEWTTYHKYFGSFKYDFDSEYKKIELNNFD